MKKTSLRRFIGVVCTFGLIIFLSAFSTPKSIRYQTTASPAAQVDISKVGGLMLITWPSWVSISAPSFGHSALAIIYTYGGKHYVRYTQHDGTGKSIRSSGPAEIVKMNNGRLDQAGLVRLLKDKILMGSSGSPKYNMKVSYIDVTNDVALKAVDYSVSKIGYSGYNALNDNCATYVRELLKRSTKLSGLSHFSGPVQSVTPDAVFEGVQGSSYNGVQVHQFEIASTGTDDSKPRPDDFSTNYRNLPRSYYLGNASPLD
jgi:hypothetical protein